MAKPHHSSFNQGLLKTVGHLALERLRLWFLNPVAQRVRAEHRQEGLGCVHTTWGLKTAQNTEAENPHSSPCLDLLLSQPVLRTELTVEAFQSPAVAVRLTYPSRIYTEITAHISFAPFLPDPPSPPNSAWSSTHSRS